MTETIKIKYLPGAQELKKIEKGDWIDLPCLEDIEMKAGEFQCINLGVAMEIPEGYEAIIAPRSSTFKKWGLIQTNSIGVIDSSYCGDDDIWLAPMLATRDVIIPKDTRLVQFRLIENQPNSSFEKVEHLKNPNRSGFGSTGD